MPTILTAGKEQKRAVPFWAQQPWKCPECSCEFEMDAEEAALVFEQRAVAGGPVQYWHVYCPHCANRVTAANPDFTPPEKTDAEKLAEAQAAHTDVARMLEDSEYALDKANQTIQELKATVQEFKAAEASEFNLPPPEPEAA